MTLAERAGITVAKTQVIHLAGANAVAVRRFDRERGLRIHSISAGTVIRAATASGAAPEMGYPELARILRRIGITQNDFNQRDARELFRRMVFNILLDNTDDHKKNHSLLVINPFQHGRLKLAPAYDVLPTHSGQGYQLRLTAPVGGSVQQLAVHTVGGVVTPAQPLLVIVPGDNVLEVEAFLENKDIGFVRAGQATEIKL